MERKADFVTATPRNSNFFKTMLRHSMQAFALLTTAVPAWCAKEAPAAETPKTVNINTADAATLAHVKGIGDKLAKANRDRIVVK